CQRAQLRHQTFSRQGVWIMNRDRYARNHQLFCVPLEFSLNLYYLLSRFSLGCGLLGRCLLRLCGFSFSGCCRSLLCGCLLGWLCTAGKDFRNANRRQFLTMPAGALGVLAATLFERNYLACTTLFYDFSSHNSAFNQRSANGRIDHQNFFELNNVTGFASDFFNFDYVICGNAILLATSFNDCDHLFSFRCSVRLSTFHIVSDHWAVFLSVG